MRCCSLPLNVHIRSHLNEEAAKEYLDSAILTELVRQHAQFATGDAPIFVWDDKPSEPIAAGDEDDDAEKQPQAAESSWRRVSDKPPVWMR